MLPYKINSKIAVVRFKNKYLIRKYKNIDEPELKNCKMKLTIPLKNIEGKDYMSEYYFSDDSFPPDDLNPELKQLEMEKRAKERKECEDYCIENSLPFDDIFL